MKHVTKILIGFLVLAIVFISACTTGIKQVNIDPNDPCSSKEGLHKDDCYMEEKTCSKVENQQLRDICVSDLAVEKKSIEACNLIKTPSTASACQMKIAEATDNIQICKEIKDSYWVDNCYNYFALEEKNIEHCRLMHNVKQYQECAYDVATLTDEPTWCDDIEGPKREQCITKIAQSTKDHLVCQQLKNSLTRDVCRIKVAKIAENQEICEYIGFNQIKDDCNAYFEDN